MGKANALNANTSGLLNWDGSSFGGTSTTNHNLLVGGASAQTVANVSPGSAGAVFLSGGASANPSAVSPTSGTNTTVTANSTTNKFDITSGWIWLATKTANNSADVQFTSEITTTYDNYVLFCSNVTLASGSTQNLLIELSSNGGGSWLTSNYQSTCSMTPYNSLVWTARSQPSQTTNFALINMATSETAALWLDLYCLTSTNIPCFEGIGGLAGSTAYQTMSFGKYTTATQMNAFRIRFASNNINTGTFTLFGVI